MNEMNKKLDDSKDDASGGKIDFDEIRRMIALLEEKNLSSFELEIEGFKIKLSRNVPATAAVAAPALAPSAPASAMDGEASAAAPAPAAMLDKTLLFVKSPMVGTFYRSPDPTAAPFVDVGDTVKKGQTLCIVEAMKLMNEIESDVDGTIVDVFVENAKPVEFGQKIFAVKPVS